MTTFMRKNHPMNTAKAILTVNTLNEHALLNDRYFARVSALLRHICTKIANSRGLNVLLVSNERKFVAGIYVGFRSSVSEIHESFTHIISALCFSSRVPFFSKRSEGKTVRP